MVESSDQEKQAVFCAFGFINRRGWDVFWDATDRCWDIETESGWQTCFNARDLWALIERENQRDNER